jgi:predicted dehydrogenase
MEGTMDKLRMGVIGCGYWGPNLIRNYVALPEAEVVALADICEERLEHMNRLYPQIEGIKDYTDFFSMDLDAVVVATPPATHFQLAKDCLEQGLHTFVEKPLTLNSRDAETLIDMAQAKDLTLMVGHTFEYNPAVRKVKEIIASGELGKIYYVNAMRLNLGLFQPDMNVIWDLAPHDLSILLFLLDKDPIRVGAQGGDCIFSGKHDIAYLHLEFPDKVLAHVHVSWLDPCKVRRYTVVGSDKMLVYDDVESLEKIKIYDKGVERPPYTDTYGDFQCSYRYGDVTIPHIKFTEPLRIESQHFIDCIVKRCDEPLSSGLDGLKVVRILETAQRSLENGGDCEKFSLKVTREEMITA